MIGLISFYQVIIMLGFWPKFAYTLGTIGWKTDRWHL